MVLKVELSGQIQFLAYISVTKAFTYFTANLTRVKMFIRLRFICPEIFQMNQTTRSWVAASELVILMKFCRFWLLS